ncbi:MAG: ABC transporter permease [Bacteroidota bacterium]
MILNYLKVAFRNVFRHKLYAFINVAGLSLGIAVSILIILFVRNELSYDDFHSNTDRIFRVLTAREKVNGSADVSAWQPMPVVPALKAEFPEILHAARFTTGGTIISNGDNIFQETVMFTDPDAFRMFDIRFLAGNPATALENPAEIILTKAMAEKYFGNAEALGKVLRMRTHASDELYVVAGVIEPMPANSSLQFQFLANLRKHSMYEKARERWTSSNGSAYVLVSRESSGQALEGKMKAFVGKYFGETIKRWQEGGHLAKKEGAWAMTLQPLTNVHLDQSVGTSPEKEGNPAYSYILGGIAILVLTIACINFVTLAVGRSSGRAKEVGMRKVLGAVRLQLVKQFWGEALLLCILSLGLGLALAELFLPTFSELAGTTLKIDISSDTGLLVGLVALLLVVGVAAGSYPALVLSRFQPVETLKGRFKLGGRGLFTRVLIVFQFGLSIFLVCGALILNEQLHFLITKNLGFRPEQVVVLPTYAGDPKSAESLVERFRASVEGFEDILSVSATSGAFTHAYDIQGFQINGENKTSFLFRIDEHYLRTLEIPLKEGRNFRKESADDREQGMIVNEAFLRSMGWPSPAAGRRIEGSDSQTMEHMQIIGVVPDFHFTSLQNEIKPIVMFMNPEWPLDHLLIRISGKDIPATVQMIHSVWKDVAPSTPFNATFLDEDFRKEYENEMRWGRIVSLASSFAVALACLGLFGLVTLTVSSRTKEIGIRKVLGATGSGIVRLVSREFLAMVILGNILAWPAAYLAARNYLENYAYRIEIDVWTFVIAGLVALAIAFLAMSGQILKAVKANPVEALRYE